VVQQGLLAAFEGVAVESALKFDGEPFVDPVFHHWRRRGFGFEACSHRGGWATYDARDSEEAGEGAVPSASVMGSGSGLIPHSKLQNGLPAASDGHSRRPMFNLTRGQIA
jgi:hypothetical protein